LGSLIAPVQHAAEKSRVFPRRQQGIRWLKREIAVNPAPRIAGSSGILVANGQRHRRRR
jgi:hypothetical protein